MDRLWKLCFVALPLLAAEDWAGLERLRIGQPVRVLCAGGQKWEGRLERVTAEAMVLNAGGTERTVPRAEVLRADVKRRARSAWAGLAIGAAAGAGIGYAAGSRGELKGSEKGAATALGVLIFAPAGAGIGALIPSWQTVYRAEPQTASGTTNGARSRRLSMRFASASPVN